MNKFKIIIACLLTVFIAVITFTLIRINDQNKAQRRLFLSKEIQQGLGILMLDLREGRQGLVEHVPIDETWHDRKVFIKTQHGALEYALHLRRLPSNPNVLEVQIKPPKGFDLMINLKIRIGQ